jgi:excinuclease UvrABC helicase subunit UvrB
LSHQFKINIYKDVTMQDELVAQEILNILMESGLYRTEELALEALENGSEQWVNDIEEEASLTAIAGLQDALKRALQEKDFERARQIREKINKISSN